MYPPLHIARAYLWYLLTAGHGKGHGIHSPFLYTFIRQVLNDKKPAAGYRQAESLRRDMQKDHRLLQIVDRGAGSRFTHAERRSVSSIARQAAKSPKFGQLLFRMIRFYQPAFILELGTSLGISTCYMAAAARPHTVHTIEGAPAIASLAAANFRQMGLANIRLIEGNFDDVLAPLLEELPSIDFVFLDGNHRKEPTLRYYQQLVQKRSSQAIFVLDDIHWSAEMEEAWEQIKAAPDIKLTADLFSVGIVFFDPSFRSSQHFRIRF